MLSNQSETFSCKFKSKVTALLFPELLVCWASDFRSIVSIAGDDYVVLATDSRLSSGFNILTRDQPKIFPLSDCTVLGSTGCWCDVLTLSKMLKLRKQKGPPVMEPTNHLHKYLIFPKHKINHKKLKTSSHGIKIDSICF